MGVESSPGAIAEASQAVWVGYFAVARGELLPFDDDTFDAVLCTEVLEHVDDPAAVVTQIGRVLRPGGVFLFSTPNRTWLSRLVLIDLAQRWGATAVLPEDLHDWSRFLALTELANLMKDAGVDMKETRGVSVRPSALPAAIAAFTGLRSGRLSHHEAAERIGLTLSRCRAIAYIGYGIADRGGELGS